jgi:hypothetical protein
MIEHFDSAYPEAFATCDELAVACSLPVVCPDPWPLQLLPPPQIRRRLSGNLEKYLISSADRTWRRAIAITAQSSEHVPSSEAELIVTSWINEDAQTGRIRGSLMVGSTSIQCNLLGFDPVEAERIRLSLRVWS